jgi:uncharacterized protein (DUF2249 family)
MNKEITLETKIADLLNNYEGMKDILIDINPKFEKLNNPILRRTIAKVAGVKQAAIVGGMEPMELLNKLRIAVGQEPIEEEVETKKESEEKPSWVKESKLTFDANKLLDEEKNPLAEVNIALKKLSSDEIVAITSDFKPEPLIDEFKKKGYEVYCEEESSDNFVTYIKG